MVYNDSAAPVSPQIIIMENVNINNYEYDKVYQIEKKKIKYYSHKKNNKYRYVRDYDMPSNLLNNNDVSNGKEIEKNI
jgi:hypothetical protein